MQQQTTDKSMKYDDSTPRRTRSASQSHPPLSPASSSWSSTASSPSARVFAPV